MRFHKQWSEHGGLHLSYKDILPLFWILSLLDIAMMKMKPRKQWSTGLLIFTIYIYVGHAITCRRAEYNIGEECCPMCSPGNRVHKHCTEFSSTSCIPCIEGTFLDQPNGRTQCFPCTNCDTGGLKVKRPCTTISDAVCEPLEGFYCVEDKRDDGCIEAQRHDTCKPGQYISQRGTSSTDTVCTACTGDTYSNGTFTSCQLHTVCESIGHLIKPGSHSSDSTCGEGSNSTTTTITITIVVTVVILMVILLLIIMLLCYYRGRGRRIKVPQQNQHQLQIHSLQLQVYRPPDPTG